MILTSSIPFWPLVAVTLSLALGTWAIGRLRGYGDGVPLVNRRYALEPDLFSQIRWTKNATKILDDAHKKYGNRPFRLIRGDTDVLVVPVDFIPEMNKIPVSILNPRQGHNQTLTGHLNGLDAVKSTDRHVEWIARRLTADLPSLYEPLCRRFAKRMQAVFPQDTEIWAHLDPVEATATCIGDAVNVFLIGQPACDNPEIEQLSVRVSKGMFETTFVGRILPPLLQKPLIWLTPQKWNLEAVWKDVERLLYPEFEKRREKHDFAGRDLVSSVLQDGGFRDKAEEDYILSRLVGVVQTGSTFSTSTVVGCVLANLAANPQDLEVVREEITSKHIEIGGRWDQSAFDSLDKLDSVLKEAARLVPTSALTYSRKALEPHTFSNGLTIRKGQTMAVSAWPRTMDPEVFPDPEKFIALREYNRDLKRHRATPYRMLDTQELRWGTGRWACPGRYVASALAKIILVKAIDEYDLRIDDGQEPSRISLHEFVFLNPITRIAVRRRKHNSGISYS